MKYDDLSLFTRAYVGAMFFTDAGPAAEDALQGKSFEDLAPETVTKIINDCAAFELGNKKLLDQAGDSEQNGHDFWLTRNRYGVGFWDRGYLARIGEALTDAAQAFGETSLYLGDNGQLYLQ